MRYTILTVNVADYEIPHPVPDPDPDADHVYVTDGASVAPPPWRTVRVPNAHPEDPIWLSWRLRFTDLFKYAETPVVFRIDGSLAMKRSLSPIVHAFDAEGFDVGVAPHPWRTRYVDEYRTWVRRRGMAPEECSAALRALEDDLPGSIGAGRGFYSGTLTLLRNVPGVRRWNEETWSWLERLAPPGKAVARLDQVVWSHLLDTRRYGLKTMLMDPDIITGMSRFFTWCVHGTSRFNGVCPARVHPPGVHPATR